MSYVTMAFWGLVLVWSGAALASPATDWRIVAADQATTNLVLLSGKPDAKAEILGRWDPAKDPGLRPGDAKLFAAIDECKPRDHGKTVLVNASAGGVAEVDLTKGRVRWYANAGTEGAGPHSVEVLPDNCVAVANSTDKNALQIIDVRQHPLDPATQTVKDALGVYGAHGVVFDWKRYTLFVLGYTNLYEVAYRPQDQSVKVLRTWDITKACGDAWGHDLVPDGRRGYYLTNHSGVWHFDPDTGKFERTLESRNVKSFSRDEKKGDLLSIPRERWWTDRLIVRGADGAERTVGPFPGAKFYKARWVEENATGLACVDFTKETGPVKPLHGVDNAPLRVNPGSVQGEFMAAGIPFMRTHDTAGMWGGTHYVDIPNVFPNFDADENDPASYDFAFTDAYLKPVVEAGTEIFYRLGVTIENYHKIKAYHIAPPKDFAKWARVSEHVIRHYNEGWANGFKWNIRYWEIWNEPENPPMWSGTRAQFFELYRVAANHLKKCFPKIKVGGYGGCGMYSIDPQIDYEAKEFYGTFVPWFEDFCKFTRDPKTACPLDFFSWHLYTAEPERIIRHADFVRRTLDANGLQATESVFNEWNCMLSDGRRSVFETMKEAPGAACVAAAFALMQAGSVDSAMYYDALPTRSYCGLFYFPSHRTTPCYEAFRAFNELRKLGTSVRCASDEPHVYLTAAKGRDGATAILAANYSWFCDAKTRRARVAVTGGAKVYRKYVVDPETPVLSDAGEWRTDEPLVLPAYTTCLLLAGRELEGAPARCARPDTLNGIEVSTFLRDISGEAARQTVIAEGGRTLPDGYQGHPTTVLTREGKLLCVWTHGHGGPCGSAAESTDGGRTWTRIDDRFPKVYRETHKNCPTLQKCVRRDGGERLFVFSAKYRGDSNVRTNYTRLGLMISDDGGNSWREGKVADVSAKMPPTGFMQLKDGSLALFGQVRNDATIGDRDGAADDQSVWMSVSRDDGETWGPMRVVARAKERNLCEPCCIRSPDGKSLVLLMRENRHRDCSMMAYSSDEGATWTQPVTTAPELTGDRHEALFLGDGRYLVCFRDQMKGSPTLGQFVGWVGTWDDIVHARRGRMRIRLLNHHGRRGVWPGNEFDTGYSGVEKLADGTILCTTYSKHFADDRHSSVVSTRLYPADLGD